MKRFICALLALLAVFICAACSAARNTPAEPTPAPVNAAGSYVSDSGPVSVTANNADSSNVPSSVRPAPSADPTANPDAEPAATPAADPTAAPSAAPTPAPDTPATGEVPMVPLVGAMGLILLCSAGLVMLRRF